jgi:hypothetical protein
MCHVTGECSGAYINHVIATSAEECLDICYNDYPTCNYFSYYPARNVCDFYETCVLDESETDVISGERECYQGGQQGILYSK